MIKLLFALCGIVAVTACAGTPPKKEYARAVMAVTAAQDVDAKVHAPIDFEKSEKYLRLSQTAMYERLFSKAAEYALLAQQYAEKAEVQSLTRKQQSDFVIHEP